MPVTKSHIKSVVEWAEDEGNPVLHVAPTTETVRGLPPEWAGVLASADARTEVLKLWDPIARRVPKVLKQMKRSLQGVGVLATDSRPPSIIYFFTLEDKDPHFYRGYPPASKLPEVAGQLPKEFLEFYRLHDGWLDQFGFGPKRSTDWSPLGSDPETPASRFLVVCSASNGDSLGFDLEESPALCYMLTDDAPEIVPKVWTELDEWISVRLEDLLPFKK